MASGVNEGAERREAGSRLQNQDVSPSTDADLEKRDVEDDLSEGETRSDDENSEDGSEDESDVKTSQRDANRVGEHNAVSRPSLADGTTEAPPLPIEGIPPLPTEVPPAATEQDDGWAPIWEESAQAFYFYNRFTGATQWTNPRVPEASQPPPPGTTATAYTPPAPAPAEAPPTSGYNPALHGDYDPTAWYAQPAAPAAARPGAPVDPAAQYAATAQFNRFTGRFQNPDLNPENFNDENKSRRQMNAFFDVDAAANSHDGRSLKAERSGKKLSKTELKQFKEKRKAKKEEKRRAWLRD
jgi:WW domain